MCKTSNKVVNNYRASAKMIASYDCLYSIDQDKFYFCVLITTELIEIELIVGVMMNHELGPK